MPRILVTIVGVVLGVAACSRGYEGENRAIVAELPTLDGVVLVEENHYGYCSRDTCPSGNDRNGALLTYTVDTDRYTQDGLVEGYREALADWELSIEEGCANADPSFCHEIVFASFVRGEERIDLNLDNWPGGRFELHIDARGGA